MPNWVKNSVKIIGPEEDVVKALDYIRHKDPSRNDEIDFNNIEPVPERLNITSGGNDRYYVALYLKTLHWADRYQLMRKLADCKVDFYGDYSRKYSNPIYSPIPDHRLAYMSNNFKDEYKILSPNSMEDVGKAYIDNILEYGDDTWYEWCCRHWGTKWNAVESRIFDDGFEFETAWSTPIPILEKLSKKFPKLTFHHEWADEDLGSNCGRIEIKNGTEVANYEFDNTTEAYEFACMMWGYEPEDEEDDENVS